MIAQEEVIEVAARSKIESVDEVRRWYEDGLTYKQMSDLHFEKYGVRVTPGAFSNVRRSMGWEGRLAGASPLMPWHVRLDHQSTYLYRMLRLEIRRRAGLPWISSEPESKLEDWVRGLKENQAVVDYRPDTDKGFFLTYARPDIDNDLIREPDADTAVEPTTA